MDPCRPGEIKVEGLAAYVAVVVVLALLAIGGRDFLWRLDHPVSEASAGSQSGSQVAEVRFMPEGSVVPYGSGVFVRSRWVVLLSAQSELAFAAYCGNITTRWPSEQRLSIRCELLEGEPHMPGPAVNGTSVEVVVQRRQAANPSIERTVNSQLRCLSPAAHVKR